MTSATRRDKEKLARTYRVTPPDWSCLNLISNEFVFHFEEIWANFSKNDNTIKMHNYGELHKNINLEK